MADKQLLGLTEYLGTITDDTPIYILSPDGDSRYVKASRLKTYANTDPTVVPSSEPFMGALVYKNATQSLTTAATTALTFQAVQFDHIGAWSAGAPTRLTVGPGIHVVELLGNVRFAANTSGVRRGHMQMNGGNRAGLPIQEQLASSTGQLSACNMHSFPIEVEEDDFFEFFGMQNSGGNLTVTGDQWTWFGMKVIEASI